jgi:hypothetical protein
MAVFRITSCVYNDIQQKKLPRIAYPALLSAAIMDIALFIFNTLKNLWNRPAQASQQQSYSSERTPEPTPPENHAEGSEREDITSEQMFKMFFGDGEKPAHHFFPGPKASASSRQTQPPQPPVVTIDDQAKDALTFFGEGTLSYVQLKKLRNTPAGTSLSERVKKSFRSQAMKLHPDKGGDPETFKSLGAHYSFLKTALNFT